MSRAFYGFRGQGNKTNVVWQEHESLFPFQCTRCRRVFDQGGKRWLASSISDPSHKAVNCLCDDCKNGRDPLRRKAPKYGERRTELD